MRYRHVARLVGRSAKGALTNWPTGAFVQNAPGSRVTFCRLAVDPVSNAYRAVAEPIDALARPLGTAAQGLFNFDESPAVVRTSSVGHARFAGKTVFQIDVQVRYP